MRKGFKNFLFWLVLSPFIWQSGVAHSCASLLSSADEPASCHSESHHSKSQISNHHNKQTDDTEKFRSQKENCPFCSLQACKQKFVPSQSTAVVEVVKAHVFSVLNLSFSSLKPIETTALTTGPPPKLERPLIADWQSLYSIFII